MAKLTFSRVEKKYMLTDEQYNSLLPIIEQHMTIDRYSAGGGYHICNLYYDTPDCSVIRRSVEKPYYKEKLRLRTYGIPKDGEQSAFLEMKKKIGGTVVKRRVVMPLEVLEKFLDTREIPDTAGVMERQVLSEILYFKDCYPDIRPVVYISYRRTAYSGNDNKELRVTFDTDILTRRHDLDLRYTGENDRSLLEGGGHLMEIKIPGALPMWLSAALSELGIFKVSFSKYGREYELFKADGCNKHRYEAGKETVNGRSF